MVESLGLYPVRLDVVFPGVSVEEVIGLVEGFVSEYNGRLRFFSVGNVSVFQLKKEGEK
jgi:hypothetical protein